MKIVTALNVHADPAMVTDTLESIYQWMTHNVLIIVDEAGWDNFTNFKYKDVKVEKGYYHNCYRCPYKNVTLSLKRMYHHWPNADWYCYIEYDCLVTSNFFMEDLESAKKRGIWLLANDIRYGDRNHFLPPLFEQVVGKPLGPVITMLGCCVFYRKEFVKKLNEEFVDPFLNLVKDFTPGFFPDFHGYALEEELYPTLASFYGGKVEELAAWNGGWRGKFDKYLMRHPLAISSNDVRPNACIIHPLKNYNDPVRVYYRNKRLKGKKK